VSGVLLRVEDRTEPSRAADLLTAAAEMERALGSQPDPAARLRDACRQVVPRVADWCVLTLLGAEGRPEQNLVFHANLARAEFLERFFQSYPILARDMTLRPRPFESGEPELCEEITEALGQVGIWDDSHLATLIRLGFSSSLCVPMRCGTQTLGALTLAMAESGRRIGLEDLPRAESLAARLAAHLKATLRSTENQVCG